MQAAQLVGQGVRIVLHFLDHIARLFAGLFQFLLALAQQRFALFFRGLQRVFRPVARLFGVVLRGFELQLEVVELGQHTVQALVVAGHMRARGVDDILRDAKLGADEEGVRFARHADAETVGRLQAFDVELAAGVDNARRFQREHLELGIMGRRHQQRAAAAQFF